MRWIWSGRKGIVAGTLGGQVTEYVGIPNICDLPDVASVDGVFTRNLNRSNGVIDVVDRDGGTDRALVGITRALKLFIMCFLLFLRKLR